ncbi:MULTISPECIES: hypothetical protein [Pseudonocardia]|uniref:Uncharacterized protein n=2 Tax=Pseudonocardia TaxID=1847 RepID=A0A1Y2N7Y1_PSEAH|nr:MULTISPECIES: hypothetical protein [Pseudonocardia]OSY43564.1 hypothetical protein BG845_00507 [Pseudonocardia autotrophica]TDN73445.1 hypothetical protein C8E95_2542 [Pseudonocardia autotrophica]GEC25515.1 hypothetical protein PSA01_25440 [Pseudonocardia saturnea]
MANPIVHRVRVDPILVGPLYESLPPAAGDVLLRCRCGLVETVPAQRADALVVAHRGGEWP